MLRAVAGACAREGIHYGVLALSEMHVRVGINADPWRGRRFGCPPLVPGRHRTADMSDIWSKEPVAEPKPREPERAAPYWWDHDSETGAAALRHRDGRTLLLLAPQGQSWGIYQFQRYGVPVYDNVHGSDWELLQIRATKAEARDYAIEAAERVGLLK